MPRRNPFDPMVWLDYRRRIAAHEMAAAECRRAARYDLEALDDARWHAAEAGRLERELAEWRAGPGADEPPRRPRRR
jgi:hypothetical protein